MEQTMKKVIALICTIALIVSSVTIYNNTASATVEELPEAGTDVVISDETVTEEQTPETTAEVQILGPEYTYAAGSAALMEAAYLAGETGANQYKAVCGKGVVKGIVNIQKYGSATEYGIYVTFSNADFGEMTVNGETLNAFVDGAGMIMYLSNFEYMYSDVVIKNGDGSEKAVIYVYNANGIDNSDKVIEIPEETTTKSTGSETPTTDKIPQDEYTYAAGYNWRPVPLLQSATGDGRGMFRAVCGGGVIDEIVNIQQSGSATEAGIYVTFADGDFGEITVNGVPLACSIDGSGITMYLSNFEYYYSDVFIKNSDGSVKAVIYVNNMKGIKNSDKVIEGLPIETTTAELNTTTVIPTTAKQDITTDDSVTAKRDETTSADETTKADIITAAPTTTVNKVTAPAKAKIKKITAKKKSAKKVKMTLKKVNGANGYQIAVYKTKKNAKNNMKAIVKKIVKKLKVTINSKKLKNKNNLYVKARAYNLDGNQKVYGKWSKIKKVKIKK